MDEKERADDNWSIPLGEVHSFLLKYILKYIKMERKDPELES